jgi:Flp pilus assembly pilin Flp
MRALIHRFIDDCAGATAIEYALIAAILSLVAITGERFQ